MMPPPIALTCMVLILGLYAGVAASATEPSIFLPGTPVPPGHYPRLTVTRKELAQVQEKTREIVLRYADEYLRYPCEPESRVYKDSLHEGMWLANIAEACALPCPRQGSAAWKYRGGLKEVRPDTSPTD